MKRILVLASFLISGCSACAPKAPPVDPLANLLSQPSIPLFTPYGFGHGCPIDGLIFTARHLVQPRPDMKPTGVTFRDAEGIIRAAPTVGTSWAEDIAILDPGNAPLAFYALASREPIPTEEVYWWEYAQRGKDMMRAKFRSAKVLRAPAGHLVLDKVPVQGASGSCVFNQQGEVVGLIVWGIKSLVDDTTVAIVAPIVVVQ